MNKQARKVIWEIMYQTISDINPHQDTEYFKGYMTAIIYAIQLIEGNVYDSDKKDEEDIETKNYMAQVE